jgi:CDP-glucose 4,6-dehydratase
LVDSLLVDGGPAYRGAWNFGPGPESFVTVAEVTELAIEFFKSDVHWRPDTVPTYEEATLLALDAHKALANLDWKNQLPFREAVQWTVNWYSDVGAGADAARVTQGQIRAFQDRLEESGPK